MLLKRKDLPEEGEIVLCTVTSIPRFGAFVRLEEFENLTGLIPISEVAAGRIKNVRDYLREGQVIVCRVLRVNKEKGHIDLSLRRVSEAQRRKKLEQVRQLQRVEKLVEYVAKQTGEDPARLLQALEDALLTKYESVYTAFISVVKGEEDLRTLKDIRKETAEELHQRILERIKPPEVTIQGVLTIENSAGDGADRIRHFLTSLEEKQVRLHYLGSGSWKYQITAPDYKTAERAHDDLMSLANKAVKKDSFLSITIQREKK